MLSAQDSKLNLKAEEAAIRALIASGKLAYTDDSVFWAGAFKRPVAGKETPEPFAETKNLNRKNQVNKVKVERLEIASSGDMAWEYSTVHTEYDTDETPTSHKSFEAGVLRVWKKSDGSWKVAAMFGRPIDVPFVIH